jgi:hypothetical protein
VPKPSTPPSSACPSRRRDEAANCTLTVHQKLVKQIRARMLDPCGIARGRTCQANLHVSPLSDISVLRPLLEAHHRAAWRTWAPHWHGKSLSQVRTASCAFARCPCATIKNMTQRRSDILANSVLIRGLLFCQNGSLRSATTTDHRRHPES